MKKILLTLAMLLMASNAFAVASCVEHRSPRGFVSIFVITDEGQPADGNVLIQLFDACKVVIQESKTVFNTTSENWGNWCDENDPHIPNTTDDPAIMAMDECWTNGTVTVGALLTLADEHMAFVAYWYEFVLFETMKETVNYIKVRQGLNDNFSKVGIASALVAWGLSDLTAETLATDYVDLGYKARYNELGVTKVTQPVEDVIRTFAEVGYFYLQ